MGEVLSGLQGWRLPASESVSESTVSEISAIQSSFCRSLYGCPSKDVARRQRRKHCGYLTVYSKIRQDIDCCLWVTGYSSINLTASNDYGIAVRALEAPMYFRKPVGTTTGDLHHTVTLVRQRPNLVLSLTTSSCYTSQQDPL